MLCIGFNYISRYFHLRFFSTKFLLFHSTLDILDQPYLIDRVQQFTLGYTPDLNFSRSQEVLFFKVTDILIRVTRATKVSYRRVYENKFENPQLLQTF